MGPCPQPQSASTQQDLECDVRDFVRLAGPIGRALARRGKLLVCLDATGLLPGLVGKYFPDHGYPRFFKGSERPRIGDLTYSELVLFP